MNLREMRGHAGNVIWGRWNDERAELFLLLSRVSLVGFDFDLMTDDEKLFVILDQGCKHHSILRIIVKMWIGRFN